MSKYDDLVKRLARLRPKDFVSWLCPGEQRIESVSFEDREFELTYRRVDTFYKVKGENLGEFYLHLEFQASYEEDLPLRLHEYSARVYREFRIPVKTVVVFLELSKSIEELVPIDRVELAGELISEFHYTKIVLRVETWRDIVAKKIPALLPLIPFTKINKGEEKEALKETTDALEMIGDNRLRGELAAAFYLLGGYRYSGIIKDVIKERLMQELMQSETYRELVETERRTGELRALTIILTDKFGKVSEQTLKKLQAVSSFDRLEKLISWAVKANSLKEFEKQLGNK